MEWPLIGREPDLDHAVGLIASGTGIALLGSAGVGKSRLLHELGDRTERSGVPLVRVVAAESTKEIPFAPFVELLPEVPTEDRLRLLRHALEALRQRRSEKGLVLAVDDAHLLDRDSLALLVGAVSSGTATVGLTARSGEPMEVDLVNLWTNGVIARVDLGPLDREMARRLAEARLGPIPHDVDEELWRLGAGNPLVLHELIEGAVDRTLVLDEAGTWRVEGKLAGSARLADLVDSRLRALPPDLRVSMEIIAVGAPLALDIVAAFLGDDLIELETRHLIAIQADVRGGTIVVPAHPLYGEVLKANLNRSRLRTIYRRLVELSSSAQDQDALRIAVWQREAGEMISRPVGLAGAAEALIRHNPVLAEELVRPLGIEDARACLILGRSLSYQQRFDEAEELFSIATSEDPTLAGDLMSARAQNLAFGLGRIAEARDILAQAVGVLRDKQLRARLNNERAMISAIRGDFQDARSASEAVLNDASSGEVARAAAYATLTVAQGMTGDCEALDEIIEVALETGDGVREHLPLAHDQIQVMLSMSLINAGRIGEAVALADGVIDGLAEGSALMLTWLSAAGLSYDSAGLLARGAERARRGIQAAAEGDPFGLEPQIRGLLAFELGQQGDPNAGASLEGVDLTVSAPRLAVWVGRGSAWAGVARGERKPAIQKLRDTALNAMAGEHYAWAAMCLHDIVRLGAPRVAVDHLRSLPDMPGSRLLTTMRQHCDALVATNVESLASCAAQFASMGAMLHAAETWAEASNMQAGDDDRAAARFELLSLASQSVCEGPATPALGERPGLISAREAEVSLEAASGMASAAIAAAKYISVRTVDNHLRSAYAKTQVAGREGLNSLLAPVFGAAIGIAAHRGHRSPALRPLQPGLLSAPLVPDAPIE